MIASEAQTSVGMGRFASTRRNEAVSRSVLALGLASLVFPRRWHLPRVFCLVFLQCLGDAGSSALHITHGFPFPLDSCPGPSSQVLERRTLIRDLQEPPSRIILSWVGVPVVENVAGCTEHIRNLGNPQEQHSSSRMHRGLPQDGSNHAPCSCKYCSHHLLWATRHFT